MSLERNDQSEMYLFRDRDRDRESIEVAAAGIEM
jgi:hypothetical protein